MGPEINHQAHIHQTTASYSIRSVLLLPTTLDRAFTVFTAGIGHWWVREYTWSGPESLVEIGIEPWEGGMAYEIGPYGFRIDWGRVLAWQPPHRLLLSWQIGPDRVPVPDPARASEVDVRFTAIPAGPTRIEVTHLGFDRHGTAATGYREALTDGWHDLLSRYAAAVIATSAR
jgi:uncharacterized protein YndB with AHSA1/START domain